LVHIHFSVCGIGFGHASRVYTIIREIEKLGLSFSVSTYGDAVGFFERQGIDVYTVPGIDYGRGPNGEVSIKATILSNLLLPIKVTAQALVEARLMEMVGADVVLSDTRASAILASKILGTPSLLILNQYRVLLMKDKWPRLASFFEDLLNSYTAAWSLSDELLIADYPPPLSISRQNLVMRSTDSKRAQYIGPLLQKRPIELPPRQRLKAELGFDPGEPLIAIIPTGPRRDRERFRELALSILPHLSDFQVIMTDVPPGVSRSHNARHRLVEWYDDEYKLLAASDIVVSRAGHTLAAKALALGCRLILCPIPRQTEQLNNARTLEEMGVALIVHESELRSAERLRRAINEVYGGINEENLRRYKDFVERVDAKKVVVKELMRAARRDS